MRKQTTIYGLLLAILASVFVSCESFHTKNKSDVISTTPPKSFQRATLPPDSVVFDVLLTRIPYQDRELASMFWKDVDEMEVEPATRKKLNEQGFRVGLVGASPPETLSKLLALKGRELREKLEEEIDFSDPTASSAPITSSKPVTLRVGMKSMIETRSEVCASIPILENENGSLVGKSYSDARTTLSVSIEQNPDGSVQFYLSPLLKYGAPQSVTRYQYGQLVRTQEQPTKIFDYLKVSAPLRPGQFLVMGATDARTNALGKYFFTDGGEDCDQKLLVIRLLVTQHDGQFDRFPDFRELTARATGEEIDVLSEKMDDEDSFVDEEIGMDEISDFSDYSLNADETSGKPDGESELNDVESELFATQGIDNFPMEDATESYGDESACEEPILPNEVPNEEDSEISSIPVFRD